MLKVRGSYTTPWTKTVLTYDIESVEKANKLAATISAMMAETADRSHEFFLVDRLMLKRSLYIYLPIT